MGKKSDLVRIQILPASRDPEFQQRESGLTHTSYAEENDFYAIIEHGDTEAIRQALQKYLSSCVVVGHLSDDRVRQMQYWAVCCITLGTRAAIRGGLDEMTAFNLSDRYIMQIDHLFSGEAIVAFLEKIVVELTKLVYEQNVGRYPVQIRSCLHYIEHHLHEEISMETLAELTYFTPDYFRKYFKLHVGVTPRQYIAERKLLCAQEMLKKGSDERTITYSLGYCSQSYFIYCFKKRFGLTPHQYASRSIR